MPVLWTDQNRCRLLLTILEINGLKSIPWDEVAAKLGAGYTGAGVRQQYQKLRKEVMPRTGAGTGASAPSIQNTLKRKRGRPLGKGQPSRADQDDQDDDLDNSEDSESKRAHTGVKDERSSSPERTIVKTERVDGEGVVRLDDDDFYC